MLNPKNNYENNYFPYMKLTYMVDLTKYYVPNKEESDLYIILSDNFDGFGETLGIEPEYLEYDFYPISFQQIKYLKKSNEMFKYLNNKHNNYLIIIGDNVKYMNITTKDSYNIYSLKNNKLEYVYSFSNDLHGIYNEYKKNNNLKKFNELYKALIWNISEYHQLKSLEALKDLATKFYEEKNYKLAETYYLDFLKYSWDNECLENLENIYYESGRYVEALNLYKNCIKLEICDVQDKIDKIVGEEND